MALPMSIRLVFILASVLRPAASASIPLVVSSVTDLGLANDPTFNPGVLRDAGGGGYVNGFHLFGFSDSATVSGETLTSFAHNSFAIGGINNASDPTNLTNYGIIYEGEGYFSGVVGPVKANESDPSANFAVWANNNYIPSANNKQAIGVMNALNESYAAGYALYYNTMVAINVVSPASLPANNREPTATRVVPQLFYANENLYGSFALFKSADGYVYLLAASKAPTSGLVAARVPANYLTNRAYYTYWTGRAWSRTAPATSDSSANFLNYTNGYFGVGPNTGELFYSAAHNRLLLVFTDASVSGAFWGSYYGVPGAAPPGGPVTAWSTPQLLWDPPVNATESCASGELWNYAGHAYPDWTWSDRAGGLLLSWSSCESWIYMARLFWG